MAKDLTPGAQPQAGAGGPVKTGPAASPMGNTASHAQSVTAAHQQESKPGASMSKAASHLNKASSSGK